MAGTGHGQSFSFASQEIPGIEDVKSTLKGQILSKVVADAEYPITATIPGMAKWTVTFNLPSSGAHTLLNALKQGLTGAIEHDDVDGLKYSAADGISAGFDMSAPSGGWVTVTAEFTASGSVTIAAASA